jgi:hypothetical protein
MPGCVAATTHAANQHTMTPTNTPHMLKAANQQAKCKMKFADDHNKRFKAHKHHMVMCCCAHTHARTYTRTHSHTPLMPGQRLPITPPVACCSRQPTTKRLQGPGANPNTARCCPAHPSPLAKCTTACGVCHVVRRTRQEQTPPPQQHNAQHTLCSRFSSTQLCRPPIRY